MALARHPIVPLSIPFANTPMPAYLIPALGRETEVRPLLICDALQCPKARLQFTSAEGAGGHCEMMNRSLLNRRTFDWLDDVFAIS